MTSSALISTWPMLPEDGRANEFDNVGEALRLSLVHLQKYMQAMNEVLDAAIVNEIAPPEVTTIEANYRDTREGEKFIGKIWKELSDGAVVRFQGGGYPS